MDRYNAQNSYDARARGRPAENTGVLITSNEAISTRNYMLKKPPKFRVDFFLIINDWNGSLLDIRLYRPSTKWLYRVIYLCLLNYLRSLEEEFERVD